MKFIAPRNERKVSWKISESVRGLVKYYAEYTGHDESFIVEECLRPLLNDVEFKGWIGTRTKRNQALILSALGVKDENQFFSQANDESNDSSGE